LLDEVPEFKILERSEREEAQLTKMKAIIKIAGSPLRIQGFGATMMRHVVENSCPYDRIHLIRLWDVYHMETSLD
jgi:hypothetical protein